ncbi:MAG: hypothetical protein ACO22X_09850 [Algoriphagus sp.]
MRKILTVIPLLVLLVLISCSSSSESGTESYTEDEEYNSDSEAEFDEYNQEEESLEEEYLEEEAYAEDETYSNEEAVEETERIHYCEWCNEKIYGLGYSISNGEIISGRLTMQEELFGQAFSNAAGISTDGKVDNTGAFCSKKCAKESEEW